MAPTCFARGNQPTSAGLGHHFISPKKARNPKKTQSLVHVPGVGPKRERLLAQMAALMNPQVLNTDSPSFSSATAQSDAPTNIDDAASYTYDEADYDMANIDQLDQQVPCSTAVVHEDTGRRLLPDKMANNLYSAWKALIPTLVDAHLNHACAQQCFSVVCLFFDRFNTIDILACTCSTLAQVLIHHGLFPTAPSQPRMAVSVDLLAFYRTLFERSCDAIHALTSALKTHYAHRGFQMTNADASFDLSAFFYPNSLHYRGKSFKNHFAVTLAKPFNACFGGVLFGRSLSDGRDIHIATDGNFHHRHRRSAGNCPRFYKPSYFLPKTQVDEVGRWIISKRKHSPKIRTHVVPDEAINQCEHSYEAADGKKQKAAMDSFDDMGIMALICRHDIPLFFANIDSPGEQQKYAVALIEHLFSLLPQEATVITLYDVGCVLSRSLSQYDILPDPVTSRLQFATTAMHAYGHEWACQLEYNPQMITGLGLSDGEAGAIGMEMRVDLGEWIKRRLKCGVNAQGAAAKEVLNKCGIETDDLQAQWEDQKKSQLSIHAHAPARLKKELDIVLALQSDLDASDRALQATRAVVEKGSATKETLDALDSLERSHDRLMNKVEVLYSSLNVHDRFPELQGVDLDFVQTLLMARDLKIDIRKRAIGSFFEWDKLDHAVGGANQALGTKLHQQTHKAIAKRQPALMTAICKFNSYCERLKNLYDPSWGVPLPAALPTKLGDLRNDQTLMEDVWITPSVGDVPRWMEDADIRDGIRAMLKQEQCHEEQRRLGLEADNLCRWFGDELAALELALHSPAKDYTFTFPLQQRRDHVLQLQTKWVTPLASSIRFASNATAAVNLAISLCESKGPSEDVIYRLVPTALALADPSPEDDTDEYNAPAFKEANEEAVLMDILPEGTVSDNKDDEGVEEPEFTISWELPENLRTDTFKVPRPEEHIIVPASGTPPTQVRPAQDGFPRQVFDSRDQSFLAQPTACLNDTCINGCAALLYSEILMSSRVRPCAILSTHDLPCIRYNVSDEILWRNTSWTSFWDKDIWILPIHCPSPVGHWVLCAIYFQTKELHLFDSLAERQPWKNDVKVSDDFSHPLLN
ncbi:hypothetical protein EV702DRAFT_1198975 [Suillus placidus]|uniref:Ubiquitin-like protease family profile domain-containing protein n=1 Tax=Suillus placidus TaxID=48579 RepID=A0A9P7D1P1_9AGAM|nr:hypothetical protein EV702DRAFT_1198975 [Suillus placidus]